MSALENEATANSNTFDHFGRTWTVPNKKHATHTRAMRAAMQLSSAIGGGIDLMIAETFLSPSVSKHNQQKPDQFEALLDIDPTDDELDEFATALAKAIGLGDSGNSSPS